MIQAYYPASEKVAQNFSRSAGRYDSVAILQRNVAEKLLALQSPAGTTVDLGCGTGFHTQQIAGLNGVSSCIGVDIAEGMLQHASAHYGNDIVWLKADAESIPLEGQSVDTVFSSLMVQWLGPESGFFNEVYRLLKPGGKAVISTLVEGTLEELKLAWQQVDSAVHVNQFETVKRWLKGIEQSQLQTDFYQVETVTRYFDTSWQVLKDLNVLGAKNVNQGRPQGLTGRRRIAQFDKAYERFRNNGKLPCRYKVMYMVLSKNG